MFDKSVLEKLSADGKQRIRIVYEEQPKSPREWDNLGTFEIHHHRYDFGDSKLPVKDYNSWTEIEEKYILGERKAAVYLPVYMYDHSGITINTTGFDCSWDSGQIGYIYITADRIKKEYGNLTAKTIAKVRELLIGEIKTLDQYLRGEVYGYIIEEKHIWEDKATESWEDIDSCYGYYGEPEEIIKEKFRE
jgi:hypothetical protein